MGLRRNFEKYKKIFFEKFNLENNIHAFWWSPNRGDGMENYGDILNPFLIEKLTSRKIIHINLNELKNNLYKKEI
ncbi:hypothetical protein [Flavobacterium sp.]|uniref:hypothetical protein n=1 Tax=Flavobacterium sp. TaxID=239 RepID=UPI0035271749